MSEPSSSAYRVNHECTTIPAPLPVPCTRFSVWRGRDEQHKDQSLQVRLESDGTVFICTEDKRPGSPSPGLKVRHTSFDTAFDVFNLIVDRERALALVFALDLAIHQAESFLMGPPTHNGPCTPESGCDALCMDRVHAANGMARFIPMREMFLKFAGINRARSSGYPGAAAVAPEALPQLPTLPKPPQSPGAYQ